MNGFLVINKQKDMTSTDVVRVVKKKLQIKKVGHSGTLDPMTTGVLVIAINRGTKYLPILTSDKVKIYRAVAKFGMQTDSYDITGNIIEEDKNFKLNIDDFKKCCLDFIGEYQQYPPIYSAKKVDGKRLYEYARESLEVEIKPSQVSINSITNIEQINDNEVMFEVSVSKGTYIRSLIHDIAKSLGTCATMSELERLQTDGFTIKEAIEIDDISWEKIVDLEKYLLNRYPTFYVEDKIKKMVENGVEFNRLQNIQYPLLYIDKETQKPIALYDIKDDIKSKPVFMLGK